MDIKATSLINLLFTGKSERVDPHRDALYSAQEWYALCRHLSNGYSGRAIRTRNYLYNRNYETDRWLAGVPQLFGDIDAYMLHYHSTTKMYMLTLRDNPDLRPLYEKAFKMKIIFSAGKPGELSLLYLLQTPDETLDI